MRILIGPVEVAGVSNALSHGLRALGHDPTVVVYRPHPFGYPYDHLVPTAPGRWRSTLKRGRFSIAAALRWDAFVFNFGHSLMPRNFDLPFLTAARKPTAMLFHGSDIRHPDYLPSDLRTKQEMIKRVERWTQVRFAQPEYADHLSQPYYQFRVPTVLPAIQPDLPPSEVPQILHAPSDRGVKGTESVRQAIRELEGAGIPFRYREITGSSHQAVVQAVRDADIIVDQLRIGWYGAFAVEAMAYGKPVVAHIRPDLVTSHGIDPPIVRATPNTLTDALSRLVVSPDLQRQIGRQSREFVERYHASIKVAAHLIEAWEETR